MTDYAIDALLAPIDDAAPTGPDLEYDADFLALEREAAPKAERVMGDEVKAAEEPNWGDVAERSQALLQRSKDLRVAVHLATAWMRISGLPGWAAGMQLVRGLLESYWDGVYPQLDADDDNDPTARVNAVAPIASFNGALGYFEATAFVQSPRLGRYSLHDLRVATGDSKPSGADGSTAGDATASASLTEIEACCMDCDDDELTAVGEALAQTLEHVQAIDGIFNDNVGTAGPDLKPLLSAAKELKKFVDAQRARRHPDEAGATDGDAGDATGEDGVVQSAAANSRINGPQDVVRRIDEICDYYARAEPSSPVPLLLRRAQRLVGLSFADLMKDLAPSGVSELQMISGAADEG